MHLNQANGKFQYQDSTLLFFHLSLQLKGDPGPPGAVGAVGEPGVGITGSKVISRVPPSIYCINLFSHWFHFFIHLFFQMRTLISLLCSDELIPNVLYLPDLGWERTTWTSWSAWGQRRRIPWPSGNCSHFENDHHHRYNFCYCPYYFWHCVQWYNYNICCNMLFKYLHRTCSVIQEFSTGRKNLFCLIRDPLD